MTSEDIKDILLSESSLGLSFADNLFIGRTPVHPDNCVTIFDTPGKLDYTLNQSDFQAPAIQIQVRNNNYLQGYQMAMAISFALTKIMNIEVNGVVYNSIRATSLPFLLEWDQNNRVVFVVNYEIISMRS